MPGYSPFDKAIHDLRPSDLTILRTVHEGWYVEYKRQVVNAGALAKSLSAFANTYGGWLFLGVQEGSGDNAVADEFPGIPEEDVDSARHSLRHSAADHLNPTPFFETMVLRGPCAESGLAEGRAIIVVEIPQSHTAPHVHKKGHIYRRVADGSEPKPETDRFVLDQLWRRAEPLREMIRKWVERDPEFSPEEENWPHVRMLLCVDPWYQRGPRLKAPFPEIRRILAGDEKNISVPFDTVYTTAGEIVARQLRGNNPHNYGLTWRIQSDLSCDIVVPLPFYIPGTPDSLIREFDGYIHAARFIDLLKEQGHSQPRIADLNFMMHLLLGIISQYRHLLKLADAEGEFYFKARVLHAWRIVPFIDSKIVLDEFEAHGLPMMMNRTVTVPFGDAPDSFVLIDEESGDTDQTVSILQAASVFMWIAMTFGVPIHFEGRTEATKRLYAELLATAKRAKTVQQNRNKQRAGI